MQKIYLNLNFDGAAPLPGGEGTVGNVQGTGLHNIGSGDSNSQVNVMRQTLTQTDKKNFPRRQLYFNKAFSKYFKYFSDEETSMKTPPDTKDLEDQSKSLMKQAENIAKPIKFSAVPVTHELAQYLFNLWTQGNSALGAKNLVHAYNQAGNTMNRGVQIQGQSGNAMAQKSTDGKSIWYKGQQYTADQLKGMKAGN